MSTFISYSFCPIVSYSFSSVISFPYLNAELILWHLPFWTLLGLSILYYIVCFFLLPNSFSSPLIKWMSFPNLHYHLLSLSHCLSWVFQIPPWLWWMWQRKTALGEINRKRKTLFKTTTIEERYWTQLCWNERQESFKHWGELSQKSTRKED